MNKQQAKRIALATEASYILHGAETHAVTDLLSDKDGERFRVAQKELAWDMLRKAGFDEPMQPDEIITAVLGK